MNNSSNYSIEGIILSNMMSNSQAASYALEKLSPSDFLGSNNQVIFAAIGFLFNLGKTLTPEEIFNYWNNQAKDQADMAYLYGLQQQVLFTSGDISSFIDSLKKNSLHRQLYYVLNESCVSAKNQSAEPEDIYQKVLDDLDVTFRAGSSTEVLLSEAIDMDFRESGLDYLEYIKFKMDNPELQKVTGISTGFKFIDDYLDGINKGHYIIIGARPGVGKTTFILNLMRNLCVKQDIPIGFFSLEMRWEEVLNNFVCQEAGVSNKKARRGEVSVWEYQKICEARDRVKKSKIYIEDKSPLSISQIMARTRRWVRNHGIQVLFIDYLGEIVSDQKFFNRQEAVQHVSKSLRNLAKTLKIPIICCAQLNRESERTATRPPIKSDLRESGQIEADAHSILLLHRPESDRRDEEVISQHAERMKSVYDDPDAFTGERVDQYRGYDLNKNHPTPPIPKLSAKGNLEIHIVKNRFGEEGKLQFDFRKDTGQIFEVDHILPGQGSRR